MIRRVLYLDDVVELAHLKAVYYLYYHYYYYVNVAKAAWMAGQHCSTPTSWLAADEGLGRPHKQVGATS